MHDENLKNRAEVLLGSGRSAAQVAAEMRLPIQTIYFWRRKLRTRRIKKLEKALTALGMLAQQPERATGPILSNIHLQIVAGINAMR